MNLVGNPRLRIEGVRVVLPKGRSGRKARHNLHGDLWTPELPISISDLQSNRCGTIERGVFRHCQGYRETLKRFVLAGRGWNVQRSGDDGMADLNPWGE